MRGLSAVALLLAAALPAAGETGLETAHERLGQLQARIRQAMDGAEGVKVRLQSLREEYAEEGRLRAVERERESLRSELRGRVDAIQQTSEEYEALLKTYTTQMAVSGLSRMWDVKTRKAGGKERLEMEAGAEVSRAMQYDSFRKEYSALDRELKISLAEDETAFHAARASFAEARRRRWTWASAGLVVLALGGMAVLAWRRRAPAVLAPSPLSGPVVAPLSGPVGSRLSGPAAGALEGGGDEGLAPGTILGENLRVERELGRGGMGVVYEALDLALQRRVAVKRMREEVSRRERDLERFLSEARLVAALKHPNIVEIHGILREGREVYLVFELVTGRPLDALLSERSRLPAPEALGVVRPVASALDFAHAHRVIHRDLKPANIMISDEAEVKVMDFGLAHQASQTVARLTKAESWGTPPYMAPEQELGEVARASDVFSLGVCVYEMLTGRLPFEGPDFLAQKRAARYAPPSRAGLPLALDLVLERALAPKPEERFGSAGELALALAAALEVS